jgi:arabinose-5-phosphate isomerase
MADIPQRILATQQAAVAALRINPEMRHAIELCVATATGPGGASIITTGMGKAGIIAAKMSATLASIGLPSFYVSPADAAHGDLGRIKAQDLVIAFSHSGTTAELASMLSHLHALHQHQNNIILVTGAASTALPVSLVVSYGSVEEACVVPKVPSTSTTLMLIIADVVAIAAAEELGLSDAVFKPRHYGGAIGQAYQQEGSH